MAGKDVSVGGRARARGFGDVVGRVDVAAVRAVAAHRRARIDSAAVVIAHLGRGGIVWVAGPALVRLAQTRRAGPALEIGLRVLAAFAGSAGLARIVRRARPCPGVTTALVECPEGPGLPSDQVAAAFAGAAGLSRAVPAFTLPLHAGALAVALARVYVGVHYASDVAAGALIGILLGRVGTRLRE